MRARRGPGRTGQGNGGGAGRWLGRRPASGAQLRLRGLAAALVLLLAGAAPVGARTAHRSAPGPVPSPGAAAMAALSGPGDPAKAVAASAGRIDPRSSSTEDTRRVASAGDEAPSPGQRADGGRGRAPLERLGLGECVRRALAFAPEVEVARSRVAVSQAKLHQAEVSRFLPEAEAVDYFGLARRAEGTVLDPKDTVDTHAYGPFNKVEVNLVQPLFTWGKITAGIEAATHAVEAQIAAGQGVAAEVAQQVKSLYYNVIFARSVQGVVEEVNDAFTTALETARRRRDQGDPDVTELGVLYLRVGQAQSAKELPQIRRGSENALLALRRVMGEPPESRVDVRERRLRVENANLEPLEAYAERLFINNPSWRQIDAGMAAKAQEVRTVEADFYPMFFMTGNFKYGYAPRRDRQLNPFAYDTFNVLEGPGGVFGVRWPLNFHVTAARADTARAELGLLEAQRRQAATGLPLELKTAYDRVVDGRTALDAAEAARKSSRAILTLAVTNFDVGIGEPREIIEALATYSRVSTDYYTTVRDYDMALAGLSRIMGEEVADIGLDGSTPALAVSPADLAIVHAAADRRTAAALDSLAREVGAASAAVSAPPPLRAAEPGASAAAR